MSASLSIGLAALAAQVPALAMAWRDGSGRAGADGGRAGPTGPFWAVLCVAGAGAAWIVWVQVADGWQGDLSATLWVSVAATFAAYAVCGALWREAAGLSPLLFPYMALLSVMALLLRGAESGRAVYHADLDAWLALHIAVSVATYAVATLAAIAALAAFLQERALKAKSPLGFAHRLPPLAFADAMTQRLLLTGGAVLGLGIATGVFQALGGDGTLRLDHKTVLSVLAFVVIALVLWAHHRFGLRGRRAARGVLLAYLLLTLGYPGVKFVRDVLIGGS